MSDRLADLLARNAVLQRAPDVAAQLVRAIKRDERGHRDQAAVALRELLALPDVAEQQLVGELAELGKDVAHLVDGRIRVGAGGPEGSPDFWANLTGHAT